MPGRDSNGNEEGRDWLNVLSTCLGLALTLYLVWETVPAIRVPLQSQWVRFMSLWRARKAREREITQMSWEMYLVRALMERPSELAERLEID